MGAYQKQKEITSPGFEYQRRKEKQTGSRIQVKIRKEKPKRKLNAGHQTMALGLLGRTRAISSSHIREGGSSLFGANLKEAKNERKWD